MTGIQNLNIYIYIITDFRYQYTLNNELHDLTLTEMTVTGFLGTGCFLCRYSTLMRNKYTAT
jgi:hypothetical protein